jgi:cell wall-associated NlpC family hydrolase
MSKTGGRHSARHRAAAPQHAARDVTSGGFLSSVPRRQIMATASAAAVGMAMSVLFALPADAAPGTVPTSSYGAVVDREGRTAAQIMSVSANVESPTVQEGNDTALALADIVAEENHDYSGASVPATAAAISAALSYGGPRQTIIQDALTYLGDPYVIDGTSHSGIDCSGLVMVAYAQVGISLVHLVSAQDAVATTIPQSDALPGDLVVYDSHEHIGLYLGDNLVIQAPHPGEPVDIVPMFSAPHHFARLLPAGT